MNSRNQYTERDVPGYLDILGSANSKSTVTVNGQSPYRRNDYFREEIPTTNRASAIWEGITNVASLSNGTNAPYTHTNSGNLFLAKTPESFGYDADGNLTNDGRFVYLFGMLRIG